MTIQSLLRGTSLLAISVAFFAEHHAPAAWAADPAAVAGNALPAQGRIVAGQGTIQSSGAAMTVRQASPTMTANWQSFNVGRDASVRFEQPGASSVAVNRVTGGGQASQILGNLSANGRVFVVDPAGVVIGPGARVDVGGLVATSLDVAADGPDGGRYALTGGAGRGAVRNLGEIAAKEGGFVALVAPQVANDGAIFAPGGTAALAAGQSARLELGGGGLIGVQVDSAVAGARIDNRGVIAADGGRVIMTARQAGPMLATAINQSGVVRANSIATRNGEIWIDAGPQGGAAIGGSVEARGQTTGQTGGRVTATGERVDLTGAIDASGAAGGGTVLIGGGWQGKDPAIREAGTVVQAAGSAIKADATEKGRGGTVVLWSRDQTQASGRIQARGAGGEAGGQVETSSRGALGVGGEVQVGTGGQWLLDPDTVTIATSGGTGTVVGGVVTPSTGPGALVVDAAVIEAVLNTGGNVTVQANNDITISSDIAKTAGAGSTLTFLAAGNIQLGAPGVTRNISGSNADLAQAATSSLTVVFGSATQTGGMVTLYGQVNTNGGNFVSFKPVTLANAQPISTTVGRIAPGGIAATPDSGSVTFHQQVTLANAGLNSVTISTQSVASGSTFVRRGGEIDFKSSIVSFSANTPWALTLNSTGAISIAGSGDANYSGKVTFGGQVGTALLPLDSLTVLGPSFAFLNTDQINLKKPSGDTMTFGAPQGYRPRLVLGADSTTINVTGFASGSADYEQKTFDIVLGNAIGATPALAINSGRSVEITNFAISATRVNAAGTAMSDATAPLTVTLQPGTAGGNSGAIALQNATIATSGGALSLATAANRAFGVATEQNTDAVRLDATTLDTTGTAADGALSIFGTAPVSSSVGGYGVAMTGVTTLRAGRGDISISGIVQSTSGSAEKDAVVIGAGGRSTVSILTTTGAISITGDANGAGFAATSGASYNGVVISDAALIRSTTGSISVRGTGGGGNNNNVGQNHGILLSDDDTQIVSTTGNILLTGRTGGKTTSYGIRANGNSIAIGQARNTDTDKTVTGQPVFTGNIDLVADSMSFANSSSSRLRVTGARNGADPATGQLNIRPLRDVNIQLGGTEPSPASTDAPADAVTDVTPPLFLASSWFSGSTAVFQDGFGEINIGRFAEAGTAATRTLSVHGATTVRDPLNLLMTGATGSVLFGRQAAGAAAAVTGLLTVDDAAATGSADPALFVDAGTGGAGRIAAITANSGIVADRAMLRAGGDIALAGPNILTALAAESATGTIRLANSGSLALQPVSTTRLGSTVTISQIKTTDQNIWISATALQGQVPANPGNIVFSNIVDAGTGAVALQAAGAVTAQGASIVRAGRLSVQAGAGATLDNANQVGVLAGSVTGALTFRGAAGISIDSFTVATPDATSAVGGATISTASTGLSVSGTATLTALAGPIVQTAGSPVTTGALIATATGDIDLSRVQTNAVGALTATSSAGEIKLRNNATLTLNALATQAAGKDVSIQTATGNLLVADAITAGTALSRGIVRLQATAGAVTQTAAAAQLISASQLAVVARDTSVLGNDNAVGRIAGSISGAGQGLSFAGAAGILVETVAAIDGADGTTLVAKIDGISAPGMAELVARAGDITQTQPILVGTLNLLAQTGAVTLQNATNQIGTLTAQLQGAGKAISVVDLDGLVVGDATNRIGAGTRTGITTSNGSVTLNAAGVAGATTNELRISRSIAAGTGKADLQAGLGAVTLEAGVTIGSANATLSGKQDVSVAGTITTVDGGAGNAGTVTLTSSAAGVSVGGTVTAAAGITASGQTTIAVAGALDANGGAVSLAATTQSVSVTGSVEASAGVSVTAGDGIVLDGPVTAQGGSVTASATLGNVSISDPVAATTGIGITSTAGSVSVDGTLKTTGGDVNIDAKTGIAVTQSITASAGAVTLTSATGAIGVTGAAVTAANAATLTANGGKITVAGGTPEAAVKGSSATLSATDAIDIGGSLTATTGAVSLTSSGATLTVAGNVTGATGVTGNAATGVAVTGTVTAQTGNVTLAETALAGAGSGVAVTGTGRVVATAGSVSATASRGDIQIVNTNVAAGAPASVQAATGISLAAVNGAANLAGPILTGTNDLTVTAVGALTASRDLTATTGRVSLSSSAGAATVSAGTVTAGSASATDRAITVSGRTGATVSTTLAAASGRVLVEATLGPVGLNTGAQITAGRDVLLAAAGPTGNLTLQTGTQVTGGTGVVAQSASGSIGFDAGSTVTATTGSVSVASGTSATLAGTLGATAGAVSVTATLGNIALTGGSVTAFDAVTLSAGAGTVTQSAGASLTAAQLRVSAGGAIALAAGTNNVGVFAASTGPAAAAISYVDADTLTIGTVGATVGIQTAGGDVALQAGRLVLEQALTTGGRNAGTVTLAAVGTTLATGGIDGSAAAAVLTAQRLRVESARGVELTAAGNNVATLAANVGTGSFDFRGTGDLAIDAITSTRAGAAAASTTTGLSTTDAPARLRIGGGGSIAIAQPVGTGTGTLSMSAGGTVTQTAPLTAGALRVESVGLARLPNVANRTNTIAASSGGDFIYREAGALRIGTVDDGFGSPALAGISADGRVDVHAVGAVTVASALTGRADGRDAVLLRAEGPFTNLVGRQAVAAPNGRFLIYEESLLYDPVRIGDLPVAFRQFNTPYRDMPPGEMLFPGNGLITTARGIDTDEYVRGTGGGAAAPRIGQDNTAPQLAHAGAGRPVVTSTSVGDTPLAALPMSQAPVAETGAGARPFLLDTPILVSPQAGRAFQSVIGAFAPAGTVEAATLTNGAPLPDWIAVDLATGMIAGLLPAGQSQPVDIRVTIRLPDGRTAPLTVRILPAPSPSATGPAVQERS
jgi:filamentous hemagglutinin family protein